MTYRHGSSIRFAFVLIIFSWVSFIFFSSLMLYSSGFILEDTVRGSGNTYTGVSVCVERLKATAGEGESLAHTRWRRGT